MLNESQQLRLIQRWEEYLNRQKASSSNIYGSAQGQMEILLKYCQPPADLLFLGCGDGLEVHEANALGYQASGVTLGPSDIERGKTVYGLDLVMADAHFLPDEWEGRFDMVLAFQTLEHSLSGMLFCWEMLRILRPRGVFYAEVPHQNFTLFESWHHITSPTPDQMRGWLMKLGFLEIDCGFITNEPDAAHWAYAKGMKA